MTETEAVSLAKSGNPSGPSWLYTENRKRILAICYKIAGSYEDAEDLTQDAFVRAFEKIQFFEERAKFSTWVSRIAINLALMKKRKRSTVEIRDNLLCVDENLENVVSSVSLQKLLQNVSTADKNLLHGLYCEGETYQTLAERTGRSVPALKARSLRLKRALREI